MSLTYASNSSVYMQGTILSYNPVNGMMVVNVDVISGVYGLQPIFNTEPWGETGGIFSPWNLSLLGSPLSDTNTVIPTILVRALSPQWDPQRGQALQNFLTDINAVAQIIATRLKLLEAEWYENTSDGTPLFQSLLGNATTLSAVSLVLRQRILSTPYVTGINSFSLEYGSSGRAYSFQASVQTQFGPVSVSNAS